jgi:hypothetical protein
MLARRATVNRAVSNARSWDHARQVGEICDLLGKFTNNLGKLLTVTYTNDMGMVLFIGQVGNFAYNKEN